ncbi:hypothetical protein TrRE_jg11352 [Triparma retinervis]|uniref:Ribosome biogenesis protein SLX9 n=1 Tax=Triparma retinervis TaxID=2557542 RepID=A0A9W6ZHA2_9STRA|nr:hypothetical protein TrRE_jg11352 [Triparma retinervis]
MPKANKVGKTRQSSKSNQQFAPPSTSISSSSSIAPNETNGIDGDSQSPTIPKGDGLSRGQKKRLAKRQAYEKRMQRVNTSLNLTELREKKKVQGMMGGMEDALEGVEVKEKGGAGGAEKKEEKKVLVNTNHRKHVVGVSEVSHMKLVLEHPEFKSNPFGAIMTHLKNEVGEGRDCSGDARLGKGGKKSKKGEKGEKREGGGEVGEQKKKRNGSRKRFNN